MEILKFPIYGDEVIVELDNEDEIDEIDFIELLEDPETIWLAEENDYNMVEVETGKAKIKGKEMIIFIIKLDDGSIIIEGKKLKGGKVK